MPPSSSGSLLHRGELRQEKAQALADARQATLCEATWETTISIWRPMEKDSPLDMWVMKDLKGHNQHLELNLETN